MSPVSKHREESKGITARFCLIVTSDSVFKGLRRDEVTPLASTLIADAGHVVMNTAVAPNDEERIKSLVSKSMNLCDAIVVTGGTGIGVRDVSVDAVSKLCSKLLPGFGELFRHLTYLKHGTASIATRAFACVSGRSIIFVIPGSKDAVVMALKEIILPEIRHLIYELRRSAEEK